LLNFEHAEFGDLASTPAVLVRAVRASGIPYDLSVRDASFMCALRASDKAFAAGCAMCHGQCPFGDAVSTFACEEQGEWRREQWLATLSSAGRIFAASEEAAAMLSACFGGAGPPVVVARSPEDQGVHGAPLKPSRNSPCLGVVVTDERASHFHFLMDMMRRVATPDHVNIVLFGGTFDDLRAMAAGNVFVTGRAEAGELPILFRHHGASHLFFPDRRGVQGSAQWRTAKRCDLPTARFDWSASNAIAQHNGDLAFPPTATAGAAAHALRKWMMQPGDAAHG
jgi:hypothetical protein